MKLPLYRYQCPTCGGALGRTDLYPRPELYEFQFPSYKTPLAKTILATVIAGFGLAFVSLWLATLTVIGVGERLLKPLGQVTSMQRLLPSALASKLQAFATLQSSKSRLFQFLKGRFWRRCRH
ncbi:hypothetical protein [Hydrogenophaga sp.]|uniref:hypothetical protein n=1 Tax=Hydrogenophaga sp. TaxID=1904254 RepID=UPI0025B9A38C|nr:hypothetical protein [Hydrogenophaga sp.]MBT9463137.1 hypothetical protein [Hydrogenophaga sp.]